MTDLVRNARDWHFLHWVADRLVYIYKESPNVDFVLRLREMAEGYKPDTPPVQNLDTPHDARTTTEPPKR